MAKNREQNEKDYMSLLAQIGLNPNRPLGSMSNEQIENDLRILADTINFSGRNLIVNDAITGRIPILMRFIREGINKIPKNRVTHLNELTPASLKQRLLRALSGDFRPTNRLVQTAVRTPAQEKALAGAYLHPIAERSAPIQRIFDDFDVWPKR